MWSSISIGPLNCPDASNMAAPAPALNISLLLAVDQKPHKLLRRTSESRHARDLDAATRTRHRRQEFGDDGTPIKQQTPKIARSQDNLAYLRYDPSESPRRVPSQVSPNHDNPSPLLPLVGCSPMVKNKSDNTEDTKGKAKATPKKKVTR